ncbi:TadE/TadG family type IV pilus assembly protein [Methylobacterium sp. J-092]|uniref:TadE/TadG family type IV pilus assembly protein n=1 Tax=Methylobacterium sp. J-092 TaxID=2836667 RepID=UPI001FB912A3|nr:TadE/TadG family type IV pilus assembly protein [Methylobacterium sp. J-092]MCJ2007900.1 pilus assembly protein [Methylobacterium sp. J-092]
MPRRLVRAFCPSPIRTFAAAAEGAAAVEFALVSLPFLALVGAIIQIAFVIWAGQNFDRTVQNAVRGLFTGQFQIANSGTTSAAVLLQKLNDAMCGTGANRAFTLFDCSSVKIDVSLASSFAAGSSATPMNATTRTWNNGFGTSYACAKPGSIVVVTAAVKVPVFFSLLDLAQMSFADGTHLLQSTAVFRTEPYQTTASTGC